MYLGRILFGLIFIALNYYAIKDGKKNGFVFKDEGADNTLSSTWLQVLTFVLDVTSLLLFIVNYW